MKIFEKLIELVEERARCQRADEVIEVCERTQAVCDTFAKGVIQGATLLLGSDKDTLLFTVLYDDMGFEVKYNVKKDECFVLDVFGYSGIARCMLARLRGEYVDPSERFHVYVYDYYNRNSRYVVTSIGSKERKSFTSKEAVEFLTCNNAYHVEGIEFRMELVK